MAGDRVARAMTEVPAGEDQGIDQHFPAKMLATAFGVEEARGSQAIAGELGKTPEGPVHSRQAQPLAQQQVQLQPQQSEAHSAPAAEQLRKWTK